MVLGRFLDFRFLSEAEVSQVCDPGRSCMDNTVVEYSRASNNGPSEKRTTSLQRTSAVLPIEFSIVIVH